MTTPRCMSFALALLLGTLVGPAALRAQLGPPDPQIWTQSSPGVLELAEDDDNFGGAVAAGDFNCDDIDDLAVGVPGESYGGIDQAGRITVLYGGEEGVTDFDQIIRQGQDGVQDDIEDFDRFGEVLASGDFNDDGCDDLAIGTPLENLFLGGVDRVNAGSVSVVYGGVVGLTGTADDFLTDQLVAGQSPQTGDNFGAALAVGDFDSDGIDDLAVGVPGKDLGFPAIDSAGLVIVFYGSMSGISTGGTERLQRLDGGLSGGAQAGERLGSALAAGNLVFTAGDDLVIGSPGRNVGSTTGGGAFLLVSDVDGNQFNTEWSQATTDIPGAPEDFDGFGAALAVGDFDGDNVDEIMVGIPEEDGVSPFVGASGAVQYFDLIEETYLIITQDDLAPESEEVGDRFGMVLAVGDFDNDGADDLAASAPTENLGAAIPDAGLVHVLYGEYSSGITGNRFQTLLQVIEPQEEDNQFGFSLAAGRFDGRAPASLAIGIPFEDIDAPDSGAVNVIYSQMVFKAGFERGDVSRWE